MGQRLDNLIKGVLQLIFIAGFITTISLSASATSIPVTNYSFEDPVLPEGVWTTSINGWIINGGSGNLGAGVWNPTVAQSSQQFIDGIPDGDQVGWSNGGDIEQTLSAILTEGYQYTLTIWIGGRPIYSGVDYAVILAGGEVLNSQIGVNSVNEWNIVTVTYAALPGDPNAGQPLSIKLMNYDDYPLQVNFDLVKLDASPALICQGFLPPFDKPLALKAKNNRAIPIKMVIHDLEGNIITDADITPPVVNVSYEPSNGTNLGCYDADLVPPGLSDDGNNFRYDTIDQLWIINLATKQFSSPGTYTVTVLPGDDSYVIESCSQTFTRNP